MTLASTMKSFALQSYRVIGSRYFRATGRLVPFTDEERRKIQSEVASYSGDTPKEWTGARSQPLYEYAIPRAPIHVDDLLYTPGGIAWSDGRAFEKHSFRVPSARDLWRRPSARRARTIDMAYLTQYLAPNTYGDWISQLLNSILAHDVFPSPLVLPSAFSRRGYVRRDLERIGIEVIPADTVVRIRRAVVLPQAVPIMSFRPAEIRKFQQAFKVDPPAPRPGSILYLSREGEIADAFQREYPNQLIADVVREAGGRVVLARETTLDQYLAMADQAETVVADHGSAMCNMLFWKPARIVELFTDAWWNPYFLFLAHALGVRQYHMINIEDPATFPDKLRRVLTT